MGKKSIKRQNPFVVVCVEKREREREKEPSFFAFTLLHNFAWDNKIIAHTHTHTHTVSVRTIHNTLYCYYY